MIISNCVINLSADKVAAFAEAFRLLRPGGRLAIADVARDLGVEDSSSADLTAWTDCLGGALTRDAFRSILEIVGFAAISLDDSHVVARGFTSVIIRAVKPTPQNQG